MQASSADHHAAPVDPSPCTTSQVPVPYPHPTVPECVPMTIPSSQPKTRPATALLGCRALNDDVAREDDQEERGRPNGHGSRCRRTGRRRTGGGAGGVGGGGVEARREKAGPGHGPMRWTIGDDADRVARRRGPSVMRKRPPVDTDRRWGQGGPSIVSLACQYWYCRRWGRVAWGGGSAQRQRKSLARVAAGKGGMGRGDVGCRCRRCCELNVGQWNEVEEVVGAGEFEMVVDRRKGEGLGMGK